MSAGGDLPLLDPRTGAVRGSCAAADEPGVATAVARARRAAAGWAAATPQDRGRRLGELAARIEACVADYVRAERAGTGKPEAEASAEVMACADLFRFYAGAARAEMTPAGGHRISGHESWIRWEPLGVVAAVVPWNYPVLMAGWRCAPALAAGNAVVLKPAETTPDSALLLDRHAAETLGPDVLVTLTGGAETGRLLVRSTVDAVAFTGSARAGANVAAGAGHRRVSLELGGNSPVIVLPDAPPDTWDKIASAVVMNAGQSCAAPARVLAVGSAYETVVDRLGAALTGRRAGVDFGPLNNSRQVDRYDDLVEGSSAKLRRQGETVLRTGETNGFWRPACLLADLPPDDPAVLQEVFGPVVTVQAADSVDEAMRMANNAPQALAASVWTADLPTALAMVRDLDAGEAWVNCHLVQTAELPHGGRRASGTGTDLSVLALAEYQRPKTVTVRLGG
ncbi:aldehyde dehydrogenase family protein [Micromonospora sp. NPDC048999]|uniref:aldehyde dehydrogenase family protein n=1 Tax=Micromonospora sp. NPDC048999 TaxID=3155391 RepID=UPI0033BFCE42